MNKNLNIYLIGGNSVIGKSILNGILKKYENSSVKISSFIRNDLKDNVIGEKIVINNYLESLEYINNENSNKEVSSIYIISFGVLIAFPLKNLFTAV